MSEERYRELAIEILDEIREPGFESPAPSPVPFTPVSKVVWFIPVLALLLLWAWVQLFQMRDQVDEAKGLAKQFKLESDRMVLVREAELQIESAGAFVYHGLDPEKHHVALIEAVQILKEKDPESTYISLARLLETGASQDGRRYALAMRDAERTTHGPALIWDHHVFTFIVQQTWGQPQNNRPSPAGEPARIEADTELLAENYTDAYRLYGDLIQIRRGDPTVFLGLALASLQLGEYVLVHKAVDRYLKLFPAPDQGKLEGAACALTLKALALSGMREPELAEFTLARAKEILPDNRMLAALELPEPEAVKKPTPPPKDGMRFRASGSFDGAVKVVRARLKDAGLLEKCRVHSDSTEQVLTIQVLNPKDVARVEWLVLRRGVFGVHLMPKREINQEWEYPDAPAGSKWAPINLFYPSPPKTVDRHRLVRENTVGLVRRDIMAAYDSGEGRLIWRLLNTEPVPPESAMALVMDGEIVWYGTVDESRSGSLWVDAASPQTLLPVILRHQALPTAFTKIN